MQFPPELALHIRGYAKPAFVHWRLFKELKERMAIRHWISIRKALQGPKSVQVSEAAERFVAAARVRKFCQDSLNSFDRSVGINRHLRYWCQETQAILQVCPETKNMTPVPVLSEEQDALKKDLESWLITAEIRESDDLDELLLVLYGREWIDSDDDYVYE
jgi:hypothetical protein